MLRPPTGPTGPTAPSSPQGGQSGRGPQGKRFGAPSGGGLRLELEEGEQIAEGIADGDGAAPGLALAFAAGASSEERRVGRACSSGCARRWLNHSGIRRELSMVERRRK